MIKQTKNPLALGAAIFVMGLPLIAGICAGINHFHGLDFFPLLMVGGYHWGLLAMILGINAGGV